MDDSRLETMIGRLLQAGVLLAAALVFGGGVFYLIGHHADPTHYRTFVPGADGVGTFPAILHSAAHFRSAGWIQLGLLVLIATPVARVALAVVGFALERDRLYVVVSLIVLSVLVASLLRAV